MHRGEVPSPSQATNTFFSVRNGKAGLGSHRQVLTQVNISPLAKLNFTAECKGEVIHVLCRTNSDNDLRAPVQELVLQGTENAF